MHERVCLVTPGHLGSNPRIVKEAWALSRAGYVVDVVYCESHFDAIVRDQAILKNSLWSSHCFSIFSNRLSYNCSNALRKAAILLWRLRVRNSLVARCGLHPCVRQIKKLTLKIKADLYIGHCLASLPAVVHAARRHNAKVGFDAEDYHCAELEDKGDNTLINSLSKYIEDQYIPGLDHFTTASPLMADAYEKRFGIRPSTILNVFPLSEIPASNTGLSKVSEKLSFYWFSQTIGPGRGLEEIIAVLSALRRPVILDLRGHISSDYRSSLENLSCRALVETRFLSPDAPQKMVKLAQGYTAGLSLESSTPFNRDICLTNKAFTYLLAGVPVIFSNTRAQCQLARDLGDAALVLNLKQPEESALVLRSWLDKGRNLRAAVTARRLAEDKYNWEKESQTFLSLVRNVLSG